jgi:hypothetical protein
MRPRPVVVLAVVEAVVCGLLARHQEAIPAALFVVPMVVGYRTVARSDEWRLGLLTPSAALLMMLTAGIAQGWAGVLFVVLLMPIFMATALMGGVLASLVRDIRDAAERMAARLARRAASLRGEAGGESVPRAASPRADGDRIRPVAEPREAWQQIIIRTPL